MTKVEIKQTDLEPLPQITEPRPERFSETLEGTRIVRRYGDTEYEVYPNRDPRLDEIENWPAGQRR